MASKKQESSTVSTRDILHPTFSPDPILLDSPSTTSSRVSFDPTPRIKEISPRATTTTELRYKIQNKTLVLTQHPMKGLKQLVKGKANKFIAMMEGKNQLLLKYRRAVDIEADLRALGLKAKSYIENKIIINGIGFKETEETVTNYFAKFGTVEKVVLEKNSKGFCTGKGTLTFAQRIHTGQEFRLNRRLLRIERVKKQKFNTVRLHISHMSKDINISKLRSILKEKNFVPENIRIDLQDGKNKGYGFVEFKTPEEAERFMNDFHKVKAKIGINSYVEFSKEKELR